MIRRAALTLFLVLSASSAFAQQEMIEAHTQCTVVNGQLVLTHLDNWTRLYLVSLRQEQPGLLCDRRSLPPRCETRPIYRFDVNCSGTRVPWVALYAAAYRNTPTVRLDGNTLSIFAHGVWQAFPPGFAPLTDNTRIVPISARPQVQQPIASAANASPSQARNAVASADPTLPLVATVFLMLVMVALVVFARAGHSEPVSRRKVMITAGWTFLAGFFSWAMAFQPPPSAPMLITLPFLLIYAPLLYLAVFHGGAILTGWYFYFVPLPLKTEIDRAFAQGRWLTPEEMVLALRRTHGEMSPAKARVLTKKAMAYEDQLRKRAGSYHSS
jgi:hypothetical protein